MPVAVFLVGSGMGTEKFTLQTLGNMLVVSLGVAIASYGECYWQLPGQHSAPQTQSWLLVHIPCKMENTCRSRGADGPAPLDGSGHNPHPDLRLHTKAADMSICHKGLAKGRPYPGVRRLRKRIVRLGIGGAGEINFVVAGVVLQLMSLCTESTRLVLVQILLQRKGLKLNPITTLYYVAPCCFAFLCIPFCVLEAPVLLKDATIRWDPAIFFSNAAAAFGMVWIADSRCCGHKVAAAWSVAWLGVGKAAGVEAIDGVTSS